MVVPESLIGAINRLQQNMFINAPTIAQIAAMACWEESSLSELQSHIHRYEQSRQIILSALESLQQYNIPATNIAPADGGFYIYIDVGDDNIYLPDYGTVAMCTSFLDEQYVAFTPGVDFEDPTTILGNRRFRISYAGGIDTAQEAVNRFIKWFPSWVDRVHRARGSNTN
jgi:aspartate/methionine/tyrosine aminotransferase